MTCSNHVHTMVLLGLLAAAAAEFSAADSSSLKHIANVSFAAEDPMASGSASMFSPRMDFEQWRPLTGRGDPLRNDPTYDYEPPVLERVHYWADDTRLEREHYPERKSEVLMLGVSSRKPSLGTRQPLPSRRPHRPPPPKYEDFQYKLNDHYPMTILVPPPPPPPGHKTPLFVLDDKSPHQTPHPKLEPQTKESTTNAPEHLTSLYALQESNLIYQSSTTNQNWILNINQTKSNYSSVSSDYAGWGPTTPLDESDVNDTLNFILNDHFDLSKQPYAFYKPMLSEAPPPPQKTLKPILLPMFVPTALPPTDTPAPAAPITSFTDASSAWTVYESTAETSEYYEDTTTDKQNSYFQPTPVPTPAPAPRPTPEKTSLFDMLGSMMSMPLVNGPERPEDNLYAHASNNIHVFKETEDPAKLETMQTMQPPPVTNTKTTEGSSTPAKQAQNLNPFIPSGFTPRPPPTNVPYLHLRQTTPVTSTADVAERKATTEVPSVPYLIIQGHSKVKTYGSKPKPIHNDAISNEIPKQNETNEVKHLHTKEKVTHDKPSAYRTSRTQNLQALVENGLGSIEIQEANVGIKYDVSDGSDVPAEIYRKGIVDSDVDIDNYKKKGKKEPRKKRQVDLEDLIPFDEDTIEEFVFDFLKSRKNDTGVTGLIAQAVTSNAASEIVDDLDEDDDEDDDDDDDDDDDR